MTNNPAVVTMFNTHGQADAAVKELQGAGFDMKKISVIGKGYHTEEQVVGYYNAGDRMKYWGKLGAFWGGLWGVLFGWAFFFVPGLGPLLVAGPFVSTLIAGLEGAVSVAGLSALGAALYGIGIPKNSVLAFETAIKADKFILIAHGTAEEVERARNILKQSAAGEPVVATGSAVVATA